MMKTLYKTSLLVLLNLVFIFAVSGQEKHELSIVGGGGVSVLRYSTDIGSFTPSIGGLFGVGYHYFFHPQWAIGTGAELSLYRSKLKANQFENVLFGINDLENDLIDYHTDVVSYVEKQRALYVTIPLVAQFQTKGHRKFYASAGARLGIPVSEKYKGSKATFVNKGYYPDKENWLESPTFLGYGTFTDKNIDGSYGLKLVIMASLEAGVKWPINEQLSLYTGAYFDYGFNDVVKDKRDKNFIIYNHLEPSEFSHNSILNSSYTNKNGITEKFVSKVSPMAIGLKVRLAFRPNTEKIVVRSTDDNQPITPPPTPEKPEIIEPSIVSISGKITDLITGEAIPNAVIEIIADGNVVQTVKSSSNGTYIFNVKSNQTYEIQASAYGYNPEVRQVEVSGIKANSISGYNINLKGVKAGISGKVFDKKTGEPIANIPVVMMVGGKQVAQKISATDGSYTFDNVKENTYLIKTASKSYFNDSKVLTVSRIDRDIVFNTDSGTDMDFYISKIGGKDVEIEIENILYESGKWTLTSESKAELDFLANTLLKNNPNIKLQINSHTDTKGTDQLNQKLSEQRAKAVVDYLVSKGVDPKRLTWKGYGESRPEIKNAKTEDEHRKNRRTTFTVTGFIDTL